MSQIQPLSQSQLTSHNEPQPLAQAVPVMQTATTNREQISQNQTPTQNPDPLPKQDASQTSQPGTPIPKSSFWSKLLPSSKSPITDGRYDHFITEKSSSECYIEQSASDTDKIYSRRLPSRLPKCRTIYQYRH